MVSLKACKGLVVVFTFTVRRVSLPISIALSKFPVLSESKTLKLLSRLKLPSAVVNEIEKLCPAQKLFKLGDETVILGGTSKPILPVSVK